LRELLPDPLPCKCPPARRVREDVEVEGPRLLDSRGNVFEVADHSLSVAGELAASSVSPMLLLPVEEVEPLMDRAEELGLISFPFSFSSKPMKMRDRASL
jgi:hypothetical protein